jgi:predicted outer membrane repeat protein
VSGALELVNVTLRDAVAIGGVIYGDSRRVTAGAAVLAIEESSLSVSGCQFINNQAELGAAICTKGDVTISASVFENNAAAESGGALCSLWTRGFPLQTAEVIDTVFTSNTAQQDGGAVYFSGSLSLTSCTFERNFAENRGGVVFDDRVLYSDEGLGAFEMTNSTLVQNTCQDGNIYLKADATISSSTFLNNVVVGAAGGVFVELRLLPGQKNNLYEPAVTLADSSFVSNQAGNDSSLINHNALKCGAIVFALLQF